MRRSCTLGLMVLLAIPASAQTRKPPAKAPARRAPAVIPLQKTVPEMSCPASLGTGVKTKVIFCDVMTGRDPMEGIRIKLPPHKGTVTLTFDLHNRHTYSEEQVKAK